LISVNFVLIYIIITLFWLKKTIYGIWFCMVVPNLKTQRHIYTKISFMMKL